jgi:p-cymene methyl-monooxygenase electron transfer component
MFEGFKSAFSRHKLEQKLRIDPEGRTITLQADQTLLQAALGHGLAYPHNCTVGTCGTCKTKLTQGAIRAISDFGYTLSKQELEAGYILACQAVAREALTVIELPDAGENLPKPMATRGKIIASEALTHDILKVSIELESAMDYVAGQYVNIIAPALPRARQYSFSDAPQRGGKKQVSFFVRKVSGGGFSEALFSDRLSDQLLEINGPHGSFYLRPGNTPIVCVAGGSGLAPILSLLEDAHRRRVYRPCVLLFGARTQQDLYLLDRIGELSDSWPKSFHFSVVLSEEPASSGWTGHRGFVTDLIGSPEIASQGAPFLWAKVQSYLCGPPVMVDAGIERLTSLGLPLETIFYDKFTDASVVI